MLDAIPAVVELPLYEAVVNVLLDARGTILTSSATFLRKAAAAPGELAKPVTLVSNS